MSQAAEQDVDQSVVVKQNLPDHDDRCCRNHHGTQEKGPETAFPGKVLLHDNREQQRKSHCERNSHKGKLERVQGRQTKGAVIKYLYIVGKADKFVSDRIVDQRIVDDNKKRNQKKQCHTGDTGKHKSPAHAPFASLFHRAGPVCSLVSLGRVPPGKPGPARCLFCSLPERFRLLSEKPLPSSGRILLLPVGTAPDDSACIKAFSTASDLLPDICFTGRILPQEPVQFFSDALMVISRGILLIKITHSQSAVSAFVRLRSHTL